MKMKVVGGLNSGRLLKVLKDGLGKESIYQPNLKCLLGRKDSGKISAADRNNNISFLLQLSRHCGFNPETFALAVNVLDRFLSVVKAQPKYLLCISVSCLFLAVKMVEEDGNVPTATDFVKVSGVSCTSSDLLRMERIVLDKLGWNLNPATPLYFLQVFHALCVSQGFLDHLVSQHLHHVTQKLERLLCHHKFTFFEPSTLALALLTYELGFISRQWLSATQYLQRETKIAECELEHCCELVAEYFNSLIMGQSQGFVASPLEQTPLSVESTTLCGETCFITSVPQVNIDSTQTIQAC